MEFKDLQKEHLERISKALKICSAELLKRAKEHDQDKFNNEKIAKAYNEHFSDLKKIEFGSKEYLEYELKYFDEAHQLHAQNRHHYYSRRNNTVKDVNLFDVLEAIVDISESSKQYSDGDCKNTLKLKGIYDYDFEELILNTLIYINSKE